MQLVLSLMNIICVQLNLPALCSCLTPHWSRLHNQPDGFTCSDPTLITPSRVCVCRWRWRAVRSAACSSVKRAGWRLRVFRKSWVRMRLMRRKKLCRCSSGRWSWNSLRPNCNWWKLSARSRYQDHRSTLTHHLLYICCLTHHVTLKPDSTSTLAFCSSSLVGASQPILLLLVSVACLIKQ